MSKEALKLALEALKASKHGHLDHTWADEAIAAVEQARSAPVQPVSGVVLRDGYPTLIQDKHIKETDQRLCILPTTPPAQPAPVQEPVAQWQLRHHLHTDGIWENCTESDAAVMQKQAQTFEIRPLYTTPPAAAQPAPVPEGSVSKGAYNRMRDDYNDLVNRSEQDAKDAKQWRKHVKHCQLQGVDLDYQITTPPAAPVQEPSNYNEFVETACALIKAADDAAADRDYMLDSDDCIRVLRGEWKGEVLNDMPKQPAPPAAPVQEPVGTYGEIYESMQSLLRSGLQRDQQIYMAMKDKPLYATPPAAQRQWVDLTPQDLNEIFKVANTGEGAVYLALEKVKEKNT
jgi:hypothetical protein